MVNDEESVLYYIEERYEMCPMCQRLTEDIVSEANQQELQRRMDVKKQHRHKIGTFFAFLRLTV